MEETPKICPKIKCAKIPLVEIEIERTLAFKKFGCPGCGQIYIEHTMVGNAAQISGVVMATASVATLAWKAIAALHDHHHVDDDQIAFHNHHVMHSDHAIHD